MWRLGHWQQPADFKLYRAEGARFGILATRTFAVNDDVRSSLESVSSQINAGVGDGGILIITATLRCFLLFAPLILLSITLLSLFLVLLSITLLSLFLVLLSLVLALSPLFILFLALLFLVLALSPLFVTLFGR